MKTDSSSVGQHCTSLHWHITGNLAQGLHGVGLLYLAFVV